MDLTEDSDVSLPVHSFDTGTRDLDEVDLLGASEVNDAISMSRAWTVSDEESASIKSIGAPISSPSIQEARRFGVTPMSVGARLPDLTPPPLPTSSAPPSLSTFDIWMLAVTDDSEVSE
jgi:hypothetical protein